MEVSFAFSQKINWVVSIGLESFSPIDFEWAIPVEYRVFAWRDSESVAEPLSKPIEILGRNHRRKL